MRTQATERRKARRHAVPKEWNAEVSFTYPNAQGERYKMPLLDISGSGLGIQLTKNLPELAEGSCFYRCEIHAGKHRFRGDLLVMHLSQRDGRTICGALYYPKGDHDIRELHALLNALTPAHA